MAIEKNAMQKNAEQVQLPYVIYSTFLYLT